MYAPRRDGAVSFAELLDRVADVDPEMRVRFTSPHPKDFSDDVLSVIASRPNVCKQLHMPAQSGSSSVLERMKRGYTRGAYDELVAHVRSVVPQVRQSLKHGQRWLMSRGTLACRNCTHVKRHRGRYTMSSASPFKMLLGLCL